MGEIHDAETEKAVLGCILSDNSVTSRIRARLRPEDFHAPAHQRIFAAALALHDSGKPVDHLTLSTALKTAGKLAAVGGPSYLMQLDESVPSIGNLDSYLDTVLDRSIRRRLQALARNLNDGACDLTSAPEDVQARALKALANVGNSSSHFRTLSEILEGVFKHIHAVEEEKISPVIPTGLASLDDVIGGLQPEIFAVGARTGVGKSAFIATLVQNVAKQGVKVGVFSLEDAGEWLAWRYVAEASGVDQFTLRYRRKNSAEWLRIGAVAASFSVYSENVIVDERSGLTSAQLCQAADEMVINHGCQVIVVDHLNEMNHRAHRLERNDLNIEASLQDIRGLQKRHHIPVVVACQFNEEKDVKADSIPTMADFMGAKVIGKVARVVLALVRAPDSDEMKVAILKQTNGSSSRVVSLTFVNGAAMIRDQESKPRSNVIQMPLLPDDRERDA